MEDEISVAVEKFFTSTISLIFIRARAEVCKFYYTGGEGRGRGGGMNKMGGTDKSVKGSHV